MLRWRTWEAIAASVVLTLLLYACADGANAGSKGAPTSDLGGGTGGTSGSISGCADDADCSTGLICQNNACVAADGLPPEQKDNAIFQQPQASTHYVFALSPNTSSVAVIDPVSLGIRSIPLPPDPVGLAVLPGQDAAVIVEFDGSSVSFLLCSDSACALQTQPTVHRYPAVTVSADGSWALLWTPDPAVPDQGAEGIVGVVDLQQLAAGTPVPIVERATGRRDTNVFFHMVAGAAADAVIVAEDDVAVIALGSLSQDPLPTEVALPSDLASVGSREAISSPDGSWALLASYGTTQLGVVDVAQRQLQFLTMPAIPTDVELTADGQTALAVMRTTGQVAYFPLPGALTDPTQVHLAQVSLLSDACASPELLHTGRLTLPDGGEIDGGSSSPPDAGSPAPPDAGSPPPLDAGTPVVDAGSVDGGPTDGGDHDLHVDAGAEDAGEACTVYAGQAVLSPDGSLAALFTNATHTKSFATLDLTTGTVNVVSSLEKWVNTLGIGPDGTTVVVLHTPDPVSTSSDPYQQMVDESQGYSVVDLDAGAVQLKLTASVPPVAFVFTSDGQYAAVTLSDPTSGTFGIDSVDLETLVSSSLALASAPEFAGSFSGSTPLIWITQDDPAGRISFVDLSTDNVSTATGFSLNAGISP